MLGLDPICLGSANLESFCNFESMMWDLNTNLLVKTEFVGKQIYISRYSVGK